MKLNSFAKTIWSGNSCDDEMYAELKIPSSEASRRKGLIFFQPMAKLLGHFSTF